jgi:hypothetical protein
MASHPHSNDHSPRAHLPKRKGTVWLEMQYDSEVLQGAHLDDVVDRICAFVSTQKLGRYEGRSQGSGAFDVSFAVTNMYTAATLLRAFMQEQFPALPFTLSNEYEGSFDDASKSTPLQGYPDFWDVVRSRFVDDELDTVFRFRVLMPPQDIQQHHPICMIIKWEYQAKKDGMPRQADLKRMSAFEEVLETSVGNNIGIEVACLTGVGRRTWRYFVSDPERFLQVVQPAFESFDRVPFLFKQLDDPNWTSLAELLTLLDEDDEDDED